MSLMSWYEDRLVALYEAGNADHDDLLGVYQYKWWAKFIPQIIDPEWWRCYFTDDGDPAYEGRGPFQRWHRVALARKLGRFICRWQGHPSGAIFYNANGYEPDGRCKDCGQEIA